MLGPAVGFPNLVYQLSMLLKQVVSLVNRFLLFRFDQHGFTSLTLTIYET